MFIKQFRTLLLCNKVENTHLFGVARNVSSLHWNIKKKVILRKTQGFHSISN